jgi:hypothetical protein
LAEEDRRVEPLPLAVSGGTAMTPEGIAALERRRADAARALPKEPVTPFATVLQSRRAAALSVPPEAAAKPPRPSLQHPAQREQWDRRGREPVVLKG